MKKLKINQMTKIKNQKNKIQARKIKKITKN